MPSSSNIKISNGALILSWLRGRPLKRLFARSSQLFSLRKHHGTPDIEEDGSRELLNAIYARFQHGEGVTCHFLRTSNEYHFINAFKYWFSAKWDGLAPDRENMINRSRL